jgi:NADH-quinone oxidoreductase E subunit
VSFHPTMPYESGELHKSGRVLPDEGAAFTFTPENRKRIEDLATHYPPERRRSAMIPALHIVQEQQGYVSAAAMREVATVIGCTPAEVEDVVSYYSMFYTKPVGRYVLQVCRTLSCALTGAEPLTEAISKKLGIKVGETDPTGTFTLVEVECLGACDRGPVVLVNDHWHERADADSVGKLLDTLRTGGEQALSGCHLNVDKREPTENA